MPSNVRLPLLVALAAAALTAVGCGDTIPAAGETVEVKGSVTGSDGKPLKAGMIHFKPDGAGGRDDQAVVKDGSFTSKMYVGKYKVAFDIEATKPSPGVPAKYVKFESSGLTADVKGGMTPLTFELK